jgi:ribonuclease M5
MKQVLVVEGIHDVSKIKEVYPDLECVITNGSEIPLDTLKLIKELSKTHEIIVFTDPDYPGERIRKKVEEVCPNASHAFIKKNLCISKNHKKVGVEHATHLDIIESLKNVYKPQDKDITITLDDLMDLNLFCNAKKRDFISNKLNLGHPNSKTFLRRLNLFGIKKNDLERILKEYHE